MRAPADHVPVLAIVTVAVFPRQASAAPTSDITVADCRTPVR